MIKSILRPSFIRTALRNSAESSELAVMANSVAVLTLALVLVACAGALKKCETTPHISQPPISWKKGNVILVALLKGGWRLCQRYAFILQRMHKHTLKYNVSFVAVNQRRDNNISKLKSIVNFPVYQDTTSWNLWSKLAGGKDHFLVFDECGLLIAHMKKPNLSKFFRKAWGKVVTAYNKKRCRGKCPSS